MIQLRRVLAPIDGTSFDDIRSFTTEEYYGLYDFGCNQWIIFAKSDSEFSSERLGSPDTLEELDEKVYEATAEHILSVSEDQHYNFVLVDDGGNDGSYD